LSFQPTQLKAFLTVVELGSLRAAADQLGVSPAAVSSSLASLRHAVGVPLFAREGRGVRLTPAGLSFVGDVRRMVALSAGSIVTARTSMRDTRVPLRIGAVAAAAEAFLADALAQFMVEAPEVPVELEVVRREALWNLIEERKVDIGFAEVPPKRTTLQLLAIRRNEYVVAAGTGARYDKARLARSVWLLREPGSGMRAATEEFIREYGIAPVCRVIGSAAVILRCLAANAGVSLLPRDMIDVRVREGSLQIVRTPFTPKPRPWCFLTAADRDVSADMRRFLDSVLKSRAFQRLD
jgi:DNA-binding transcriptional LysR family regulator